MRHCGRISALFVPLFALVSVLAAFPAIAQDSETGAYLLNPGDRLSITVWKEQDLQRQVLVRPDGSFSFPLAGDINARNKSVEQVRDELAQRLSRFIPDPVVTVATEEVLGNRIYVIGQVNRPGEFVASSRVDVVQALSIAGGFAVFAQKNDVKILRRVNGELQAIPFRYGDIEKGKNLGQNQILQSGDVIVVP